MYNLLKIASRNLLRYKRRTLLTMSLIAVGVIFVLVFVSVTASFKGLMVNQITDSYLGDIQIHRRGYVASVDSLPLTLNMKAGEVERIRSILSRTKEVEAYSERIKFGGMFSNFTETTNIRLNGVSPEKEFAASPLLAARITNGAHKGPASLQKGKILIPELLARGFKLKVGDTVVVVATNRQGSVNGKTLVVGGILESATGPGGRDGYVHFEDAMEILRLREPEVSEIAVNLPSASMAGRVSRAIQGQLADLVNKEGKPKFEVHPWNRLSPFATIARMIDILTFFIKVMLIAVVLISILNVMIMAVYERVREIGTVAAIGTLPGKILSLFLMEGLCLGIAGTALGVGLGAAIVYGLRVAKIVYRFGRNELLLAPSVDSMEVITVSVIVILVSVLASLQPAYKASRMEPIEALRHV